MNRREQGLRNLELARRFLHQVVRTPDSLGPELDGATIVMSPMHDEQLAAANDALTRGNGGRVARINIDDGVPPTASSGQAASA